MLCVDDDPELLAAMAASLGGLSGLHVSTAHDVAEARNLLMEDGYSVVITDQLMPGENGIDLLEEIGRRRLDAVPILLTGHADLHLSLDAINRGHVFAFLRKPCAMKELGVVVRSACERYDLGRRLRVQLEELEQAHLQLKEQYEALQLAHAEVQRLEGLASIDPKTGAYNFRYFQERLEEEFARARRYGRPLGIGLVDLDGFKAVNDERGHLAGDQVLHAVTRMLRGNIRVMDILARFGGDEFAIILPDTQVAGAVRLAARLCERARKTKFLPAGAGEITFSVGVAGLDEGGISTSRELLERADAALYRAKHEGRDRFVVSGTTTA